MLYYLSQKLLEWSRGPLGRAYFHRSGCFVHHVSKRLRGVDCPVDQLVAGCASNRLLKQLKFGQDYADKAETGGSLAARLFSKKGTPTMGGILIVLALNVTTLLWAAMEYAGPTDVAFSRCADGLGFLTTTMQKSFSRAALEHART